MSHTDDFKLRNLARRLYLECPERRITHRLLAAALGIHSSTLYRRYGKGKIKMAVKAAERSLVERELAMKSKADAEQASEEEQDREAIREMFNQIVVDKNTPAVELFGFWP